jgi:hypothetical protein
MKPYLLYIDIATFINDSDISMEKNILRRSQIQNGLEKLFEYNFASKNCDILITDNTCAKLPEEFLSMLPENTIVRCFDENKVGAKNKGAGLLQKWLYNMEIMKNYHWIIHFEGRQLLLSHVFFDHFFSSPAPYFRYGSRDSSIKNHFYTGIFSITSDDLFKFCLYMPIEKLLRESISIEYPMRDFMIHKAQILTKVELRWFQARKEYIDL